MERVAGIRSELFMKEWNMNFNYRLTKISPNSFMENSVLVQFESPEGPGESFWKPEKLEIYPIAEQLVKHINLHRAWR